MRIFLVLIASSSVALAQVPSPVPSMTALTSGIGSTQARPQATATGSTQIPPLPKGNATVIGGAIRKLDRVRDQITLSVFGGRDIKILFDARTQVYRDGQRASLKDLRIGDRVSMETMLDGTAIFARNVRLLTQSLEGEFYGQVEAYNPVKGDLTLRDYLSPQTIVLHVSAETTVTRDGQKAATAADLAPGALISAKFQPGRGLEGLAREINILAAPGTSFVLTGEVSFLDLHSGLLVLIDPRDKKDYEIHFDPALRQIQDLHLGSEVTVAAAFDGNRYSATSITVNIPLSK